MNPTIFKTIVSGLLFVILIFSGFKLKKTGHPYNFIVVSIHKLSSLVLIVMFVLLFVIYQKEIRMSQLEFGNFILSALLFILALISGGLLSARKTTSKIILYTHKITSAFVVISSALFFYLILNK